MMKSVVWVGGLFFGRFFGFFSFCFGFFCAVDQGCINFDVKSSGIVAVGHSQLSEDSH